MIQNSYNHRTKASLIQTTILEEIVGSHAAQVAVDELGLAMATHTGSKRERNEDRLAVARITAPNTEMYTIALVCDGVGGSEYGDQAASIAIASIISDLAQQQGRSSLKELTVALVRRADDLVRKELQGRGATTLVMLLASTNGHLVCANVGDSRAYSWDTSSSKLDQITVDDTIENELKNIPGDHNALINARRLQGRLSQAIGESGRVSDDLRVQIYAKERFCNSAVLGSDGLWHAAKDFETIVGNSATPMDAVRRAIALANWVGGVDNASMIAIGDMERLCGPRQTESSIGRQQTGITLWTALSKIKLLTNDWIDETKRAEVCAKPEKQKKSVKKSVKKKPLRAEGQTQLKLESPDSKDARPKVEVTISEDAESRGVGQVDVKEGRE